jgi:NAD(P)-dependent dehydrogenase (short-subunit alcohol dehydrogenase family)
VVHVTGIDDAVAIVTGGASGIGRETARQFGAEGANVVVADLDAEGGRETVAAVEDAGGSAAFVETDVTDEDDVAAMVEAAFAEFGGLDVLHNNAGVENAPAPLVERSREEFERVLQVNLVGTFLGLKAAIPRMIADGGGAVVNTASVAGLNGSPTIGAYAASKHGVVGLTRTAAAEYAREGIRVNAVCPGYTDTPMVDRHYRGGDGEVDLERTPQLRMQGRLADPEEVAAAVRWLASPEASYVNGVALPVDGGTDAV